MKYYRSLVLICLTLAVPSLIKAEIARNPIGVNVSAARPMSLAVRFADSEGALFTTTEALFCYKLLDNGQCDPTSILGRLPANRDRGSTLTPTSAITDIMTIPYSVIRSSVIRAQEVDYSDFFYVRRFTPAPGVDLGAGIGQDVFSRVTCHLAGPARVPLSLTEVSVLGYEKNTDEPQRFIRLNKSNIESGQVIAQVEHTGNGILEGWWEVKGPGDPRLDDIDLLPEAALSESERAERRRFTRIKRFRVQATTTGKVTIPGPRYRDLPRNISGRHEILLRFDATQGRENRARLEVDGESRNLFSGGIAGFPIPVLEYQIASELGDTGYTGTLAARLVRDRDDTGNSVWRLGWRPQRGKGQVLKFTVGIGQEQYHLITPADAGYTDLSVAWRERLPQVEMKARLLRADGTQLGLTETVRY